MVQYGAPASAVLKIANRAKKLQVVKNAVTKMGTSKASKIAQRVVEGATVIGATDFIASHCYVFDVNPPNDQELMSLYIEAFHKVMNNLDLVLDNKLT